VISLDRDKTPQYSLGGFNCTDWVFKNTANVFPNNAADPPARTIDLDSYTDITLMAFTESSRIAHALDMTARTAVLAPETVGAARSLRISLARLGTQRTATELQFGDGSREYQKRTFAHSYRRAGTYRLRGIVIANATVYRFSLAGEGGSRGRHGLDNDHGATRRPAPLPFSGRGAARIAAADLGCEHRRRDARYAPSIRVSLNSRYRLRCANSHVLPCLT
jgi:hypothetical protein